MYKCMITYIIGVTIILLIITLITLYTYKPKKLEHLSIQSDEAVQNVASLYNKDSLVVNKISIGKATIFPNTKTGKTDLFIDGDIHVNGNIYMNPDMDGNPKTSGSSAIIFGNMGIRNYTFGGGYGHLSIINTDGSLGMPKGGVIFLARSDGYGTWSTGGYNNIPKDWNVQVGSDASNFGEYTPQPL